jgi:hypothetical protein
VSLWRRAKPSKIDPLASPENAETFGVAFGVAAAIGANPVLYGAAALYAKAEQEERDELDRARQPHAAGEPAPGAKRAGQR